MRATPVEQVREVAEAGESMPPKSTYFYPKIPTGPGLQSTRAMKIYTRKGDDGTTGLWYGGRVAKSAGRPEAYGSVDEAASALGPARAPRPSAAASSTRTSCASRTSCSSRAPSWPPRPRPRGGSRPGVSKVTPEMVERLEADIDRYMERVELPPKFVIPGGTELSARLDVARAAVRRAERRVAR